MSLIYKPGLTYEYKSLVLSRGIYRLVQALETKYLLSVSDGVGLTIIVWTGNTEIREELKFEV